MHSIAHFLIFITLITAIGELKTVLTKEKNENIDFETSVLKRIKLMLTLLSSLSSLLNEANMENYSSLTEELFNGADFSTRKKYLNYPTPVGRY